MYSSTFSLTSALDGGRWSTPRPGRFTTGKDPVPILLYYIYVIYYILYCICMNLITINRSIFIISVKPCDNKQPQLSNLSCVSVYEGCTQTSVLIPHDLESNRLVSCTQHDASGPFRVGSACRFIRGLFKQYPDWKLQWLFTGWDVFAIGLDTFVHVLVTRDTSYKWLRLLSWLQ